ncbi:MAG: NAD(P)-dependent oxidoreductase [Geminicoccaceae bacterium]
MSASNPTVGWIGIGRMGYPMAELLLQAGHPVHVWNRTRAKAEALGAAGATIRDAPADLAAVDVLFTMVATGKDLEQVLFGPGGLTTGGNGAVPRIVVDCSSIGVDQGEAIRARLSELGAAMIAAPVSGNAKCVRAGKLGAVCSGPEAAFREARPLIAAFARRGVAYVGEGELARFCKIAHNVLLGVTIQNLAEITILAQKAGVPRHAFLAFINDSVMGSIFTRYKSNALVNLDWTTTFTPELLRKDLDLGLQAGRELEVPMPVAAATREALQAHFGAAQRKSGPAAYLSQDFSALLETVALAAGITLESEDVHVPTGLEVPDR